MVTTLVDTAYVPLVGGILLGSRVPLGGRVPLVGGVPLGGGVPLVGGVPLATGDFQQTLLRLVVAPDYGLYIEHPNGWPASLGIGRGPPEN